MINLKTLMKALPSLFEHSDKNVRAEVYMYTCMIHVAKLKRKSDLKRREAQGTPLSVDMRTHVFLYCVFECVYAGQGSGSGAVSVGRCWDKTHS